MTTKQEQLKRDIAEYCREQKAEVKRISFADRQGKQYVKVSAELLNWDNTHPFFMGLTKVIEYVFPDANHTSGGVGDHTYRLNKDFPNPNAGAVAKRRKQARIDTLHKKIIADIHNLKTLTGENYHLAIV